MNLISIESRVCLICQTIPAPLAMLNGSQCPQIWPHFETICT